MSNKVKFGLKNLYIAPVTEGEGNAITFGAPVAWPGSVSLTMEPQGDTSAFYADDGKYYVTTSNAGYDVTLETALVPDWFTEQYLGETVDSDGNLVEQTIDTPEKFAALFEFTGDKKAMRHCLFYCQASRPTIEGETKGESAEVKTESISFNAMAIPGPNIIKKRSTDATDATAYNNWYQSVTIPEFTTEGIPEEGGE